MIDLFYKYCRTAALFKKSAKAVSNTFRNMFSTFGSPFILHTDNGKNFSILVYQIYVMNLILGMLRVEQDVPGFKAG